MMNALCQLLSIASEKLVAADSDTQARLAALEGKVFRLIVTAPGLDLFVLPAANGLLFQTQAARQPDVTLSGPLTAFVRYGLQGLGARIESKQPVSIHGDLDLAQSLQYMLAKMDLDREEVLAAMIGDMPARKANLLIASAVAMLGHSARLAQKNWCEYLQEEKQLLASPAALRKHAGEVNALRSRLDRAELRVARLAQKLGASPS